MTLVSHDYSKKVRILLSQDKLEVNAVLAFLFPLQIGLLGMVEAAIEDLAISSALRGNLMQSDGDTVLSTTLPWDSRSGRAREQRPEC
jgi:hypothetical protein